MTDHAGPEEAARALTEIGQRQEQVIRLVVVPNWYWWAIAVLMVAFAAAVDTGQGLVVGIGTAVFVAGVLTTTGAMVFRAVRTAQPRNDLLGPGGVVAILGFVAVTIEDKEDVYPALQRFFSIREADREAAEAALAEK